MLRPPSPLLHLRLAVLLTIEPANKDAEPQRPLPAATTFAQRLYRHGKPFGERVSLLPPSSRPLKNKITPDPVVAATKEDDHRRHTGSHQREPRHDTVEQHFNRKEGWRGDTSRRRRLSPHRSNPPADLINRRHREVADTSKRHREDHGGRDLRNNPSPHHITSPPYTTYRKRRSATSSRSRHYALERQASPVRQLEDVHATEAPGIEEREVNSRPTSGRETLLLPRSPLECNLNVSDFTPPPPPIPSKEQVMDQLREDAHRYVNHPDPIESEARRQRVLDSNARGEMEDTAERIIASARASSLASSPAQQIVSFLPEPGYEQSTGQEISFASENEVPEANQGCSSQRFPRGARPPKPKRIGSTSRGLLGSNLRKHNFALSHRSPTVHPPANDNSSLTPARSSGRRSRQNGRETAAQETSSPSHITPIQRTSRRTQQATQPETTKAERRGRGIGSSEAKSREYGDKFGQRQKQELSSLLETGPELQNLVSLFREHLGFGMIPELGGRRRTTMLSKGNEDSSFGGDDYEKEIGVLLAEQQRRQEEADDWCVAG
ncbi:hypothetical protein Bca4012_019147 [Brassica carinata]